MRIRLWNARILTMEKNRDIFVGEVWTEDSYIREVLTQEEASHREMPSFDRNIDCQGNLLMPGFKDCHTHSAMTFLRSYADDLPLQEWLHQKVFPMEAKLQEGDIYTFTKLAILEYLTSGITAIGDMYLRPDETAKACLELGMRCSLVSGLNNFTSSLAEMDTQYHRWNAAGPLIRYQLGFHAPYTTSKKLLQELQELSKSLKAPVYTHLSETTKEVDDILAEHGMRPVAYLDSLGLFEYGGGAYHCVHLSDEDLRILHDRNLYVVTNPSSNAKLSSGIAPIEAMRQYNIPIAIGTDGAASNNCLDMFREMFLVSGLSKLRERDAAVTPAEEILRMATVNGSMSLGFPNTMYLAKEMQADMIMVDMHKPNMHPIHCIEKNIVYSGSKDNIVMTMIAGKILYERGEFFVGESVDHIYEECESVLKRLECK